jgi:hypothetical protein
LGPDKVKNTVDVGEESSGCCFPLQNDIKGVLSLKIQITHNVKTKQVQIML